MKSSVYSCLLATAILSPSVLFAQGSAQNDEAPQPVQIDRIAVSLKTPEAYQSFLVLQPIKTIHVPAQTGGTVDRVLVEKVNDEVRAQGELVRIDSEERTLQKKIVEAELAAAKASKSTEAIAVAEAKLRLAEYQLDQTIIRTPITGEVAKIHVTAGEFVRLGQPLVTVIDSTQLMVDTPVEREKVKAGDNIELMIEGQTVTGKVESMLPVSAEFQQLQELFQGLALARVIIENSNSKLVAGQTVTSKLIPRHPVMEVPNSAVQNGDSGTRKVQVIRDGFVKDLPIELYGQVGETHVFVGGRFATGDELVVSASEALVDGSWVRPMLLESLSEATLPNAPRRATPGSNYRNNTAPGGGSRTSNNKTTRDDF